MIQTAHALTHRREGEYVGEFGTGWNNSNYWFGQTGRHNVVFPEIAQFAYDVVYDDKLQKMQYRKHKEIVKFLQSILKMNGKNSQKKFTLKWNSHSFTNLCEKAVQRKDKVLMQFCSDVANKEWRLLVDDCYTQI